MADLVKISPACPVLQPNVTRRNFRMERCREMPDGRKVHRVCLAAAKLISLADLSGRRKLEGWTLEHLAILQAQRGSLAVCQPNSPEHR
jgi:hypothetical protein